MIQKTARTLSDGKRLGCPIAGQLVKARSKAFDAWEKGIKKYPEKKFPFIKHTLKPFSFYFRISTGFSPPLRLNS
jgi:hypothetical protein